MFVGAENHSTVIIRVNGGEFMRTPKGPEPNPPTSLRKRNQHLYRCTVSVSSIGRARPYGRLGHLSTD